MIQGESDMQFKKSWFGHSVFIIGTLLLSVYLYTLFVSLCMFMENANDTYIKIHGIDVSFFLGILLVLGFAGIFFLVELIKRHIFIKNSNTFNTLKNIGFWFFFAFFLLIGAYIRLANVYFSFANNSIPDPDFYNRLNDNFLGNSNSYPNIILNLYDKICVLILRVFGLKPDIVAYFNVLLFLGASVLLFFTVKKAFGKIPALIAFSFLMIFEYSISLHFDTTGTVLWFFCVSFVLFVTSYFADLTIEKKPWLYVSIMASAIVVLLVLNHFLFYPLNLTFDFTKSFLDFFVSIYYIVAILPVLFSLYAVLGYIYDKKDKVSVCVIMCILLSLLMYFDRSENDFVIWYSFLLCILSGIGIKRFFFEGYKIKESERASIESSDEEVIIIEEDNEPVTVNVVSIPSGRIEESKIKEVSFKAFDEAPKTEEPKTEEAKTEEAKTEEPKKEIKFLDNPLPVPKKHVKKSIDYAFEPDADMMKYDIDISTDDDFDIK